MKNGVNLSWKVPKAVFLSANLCAHETKSNPTNLEEIEIYGPSFMAGQRKSIFSIYYVTVNGRMSVTTEFSTEGPNKADAELFMNNLKCFLDSL